MEIKAEIPTFTIKLWRNENSVFPEIIRFVAEIKRDKESGDIIIGTIFEDIRVHYRDELKIEIN